MKLEWDENKNQVNRCKHCLDFRDAYEVFANPYLVKEDSRRNYGEKRFIAVGMLRERVVILVFTVRGEVYRIISMREANEREKKAYKKRLEGAG